MLESTLLFIGAFATLFTIIPLLTQTRLVSMMGNQANGLAIMTGIMGFVSWGVWVYGTLNIDMVTDAGVILTISNPAATFFGVAMALVPMWIAFTGPVEIVARVRDTRQQEV